MQSLARRYQAGAIGWRNCELTVNPTSRNARSALWETAKDLPEARDSDFFGNNRPPAGSNPQLLKIINDTSLRTRLIESGIAEGLQSPKGPQKIPSIIRLYPNFDAPAKDAPRNGRSPEISRAAFGLPSVEELDALLARIHEIESDVNAQLGREVSAEIARLKREIGDLEDDAFERAFADLDRALAKRRQLSGQVREEAFKRVEADTTFAPRKYLRLISREPKG